MEPKDTQTHFDRIQSAVSVDIPHLYANGFAIAVSPADVTIVLERNGVPQATLNLSYTLAKTLGLKLGWSIGSLETATKRPMLTTDEVETLMAEAKS